MALGLVKGVVSRMATNLRRSLIVFALTHDGA